MFHGAAAARIQVQCELRFLSSRIRMNKRLLWIVPERASVRFGAVGAGFRMAGRR